MKRKGNQITLALMIILALAVLIIVVAWLGWMDCKWNPLFFGWIGPDDNWWCKAQEGGPGNFTCSNPGLNVKLRADNNTNGRTAFSISEVLDKIPDIIRENNISGVRMIETATRVGLDDSMQHRIHICDNVASNAFWRDFADACVRAKGLPICNPEFLGCVCTSSSYDKCAYTIAPTNPYSASCGGGGCEGTKSCTVIEGDCVCELTCGMHDGTCSGYCSNGNYCIPNTQSNSCQCTDFNNIHGPMM